MKASGHIVGSRIQWGFLNWRSGQLEGCTVPSVYLSPPLPRNEVKAAIVTIIIIIIIIIIIVNIASFTSFLGRQGEK